MAHSRPARTSQGTDMMEYLRFPDAIEYEQVIKICNRLAKPIGSRSVTNKCYILLWKATYFSSSVFIGTRHVLDTLEIMRDKPVPCLVMLAADTFIDSLMTEIVRNCKQRVIPYIFIPTKVAMRDALNVDHDVLAVLITFNHDPGMRREFEDCFISMRSQCFKKKKKREHGSRASSSATVPPEIGPRGEMPQLVTTEVSTVPSGEILSFSEEAGTSSGSDWVTMSTDSESCESDTDHEASRDFSVNVPDESGSNFQEYVRIPSPTPAPSPSEMAAQQKLDAPSAVGESSTACSSDESVRPGPSREFLTPPIKRRQHSPHRQSTWPIALPYAPREDFDDEKIRMYLQTLSRKKKMRLRSKTSCPPTCTTPPPQATKGYMHYSTYPQPSTSSQSTSTPQTSTQQEPIDVDADDISLQWTMDDLSSTSNEQLIDLTSMPADDPEVHEISSSDDDVLMVEESSSNTQNEGAAGDGNICPMDLSTPSSASSTVTSDEEVDSARSQMVPPLQLQESLEITSSASGVGSESPIFSSREMGDYRGVSSRSSDTQASTSSSGELINLQPSSSSSLFGLGESPSVASLSEESNAQVDPSQIVLLDNVQIVPSMSGDDGNSPAVPGELVNVQEGPSTSRGLGDVPAVPATSGEVGDAAVVPTSSRAAIGAAGEGGDLGAEGTSRMGMMYPSAFGTGDGYTLRPYNPNAPRFRHRVTGTGEGNQSAFMQNSMSFMFAPRVVYTSAASDDGLRRPHQLPREEDLLAISFPVDEDGRENSGRRRSGSMDVNPSDNSSDESELSSDEENVELPSPFEFPE